MTASYDDIQSDDYWDQYVIKYTLDSSFYLSGPSYVSNVTDGDEDLFNYASTQWSNVANIVFELDDLNAQFGFVKGTFSLHDGVSVPEYDPLDNDIITRATTVVTDSTLFSDEQMKWLAVHEIGHSLGLDHPNGGDGNDPDYNQSMTAMSYNPYDYNGDHSLDLFAVTPMYFDVLAIQEKYGVNDSYHSGNDNYEFDGSQKMFTLWDGGGDDTIDASGYGGDGYIAISLNNVSEVQDGYLQNGSQFGESLFWVAYGAHIENATGGDGADYLGGSNPFAAVGDYAASTGANHLIGNGGEDYIEGLGGNDTIEGGDDADYLYGGDGNDFIYAGAGEDYEVVGGDGHDYIHLGDGEDSTILDFGLFDSANVDTINGGNGADFIDVGDTFNFATNEAVLHVMDDDNNITISYADFGLNELDDGVHDNDFQYISEQLSDYAVIFTNHQSFSTATDSYTASTLPNSIIPADIIGDDLMLVFGVRNNTATDIDTLNDALQNLDEFSVIVIHDVGMGLSSYGSNLYGYLVDNGWLVDAARNTFNLHEPVA